jgi:aromatic-L-amino-acid/L-tryptophan decarboxylase
MDTRKAHATPTSTALGAARAATPGHEPRHVAVGMDGEEFRRAGHALIESLANFLGSGDERPLTAGEGPEEVRALISAGQRMPDEGSDPGTLLGSATELLFDHSC